MTNTLWIFDYDQTLFPSFIHINKTENISKNDIKNIYIILSNMYSILKKIRNDKVIILTASIRPWVEQSLEHANTVLLNNYKLINHKECVDYLIEKNSLIDILNIKNDILDHVDIIYHVHEIESRFFNNQYERYNKKNSMNYIINNYPHTNNVIILGDAIDNERKCFIELQLKNINKVLKYVQFINVETPIIKIHEQHLLYYNLQKIKDINYNIVFDI